ncbi:MAG: DUF2007 domain-containing protein [Bacteroidaceae bacterium]|nr:DUF2007 domain-containing protein [Bacteroidaceae bacterium]MBQ3130145.1 DUF2007 domain-containing protein [Bacteroidaceae bacterium]MEE0118756.1 DUF2007 domain-containing protein [Bacteroidaceae bacterium]
MAISRLTTCNNPMEAHLLQGRLEEEGIRSFLGGEIMSGYPPMNGVTVFVEEEDYARAHALLQDTAER